MIYNSSNFFKAIENEDMEIINHFLSDSQFKLCDFRNDLVTALHVAIVNNQINVVKILLDKTICFDDFPFHTPTCTLSSNHRRSPLEIAINNDNCEIIKLLCEKSHLRYLN